jgi:hypothetical protein
MWFSKLWLVNKSNTWQIIEIFFKKMKILKAKNISPTPYQKVKRIFHQTQNQFHENNFYWKLLPSKNHYGYSITMQIFNKYISPLSPSRYRPPCTPHEKKNRIWNRIRFDFVEIYDNKFLMKYDYCKINKLVLSTSSPISALFHSFQTVRIQIRTPCAYHEENSRI